MSDQDGTADIRPGHDPVENLLDPDWTPEKPETCPEPATGTDDEGDSGGPRDFAEPGSGGGA